MSDSGIYQVYPLKKLEVPLNPVANYQIIKFSLKNDHFMGIA